MIKLTGKINTTTFGDWIWVNDVLFDTMPDTMRSVWNDFGYEGIAPHVPEHLGMSRMYRNEQSSIVFEFTDEQWLLFNLKWS
jgi:hypothetical protein